VPKLTPNFAAKTAWGKLVFWRYSVSNSASDWGLFWQGCESTLMVLITRWQKGIRNHPFRQFNKINGFLIFQTVAQLFENEIKANRGNINIGDSHFACRHQIAQTTKIYIAGL
jgi:hypothetical protein